jgi:hypothetical protein
MAEIENEKPVDVVVDTDTAGQELSDVSDVLKSFFEEEEEEENSEGEKKVLGGNAASTAPSEDDSNVVKVPKGDYDLLLQMKADFDALRNDPSFALYFQARANGVDAAKELISTGIFNDWDSADEREVFMTYKRQEFVEAGLEPSEFDDMYEDFLESKPTLQKIEIKKMRDALKRNVADSASKFAVQYNPKAEEDTAEKKKQLMNDLTSFGVKNKLYKGLEVSNSEIQKELFETIENSVSFLFDKQGNPNMKAIVDMAIAINPKLSKQSMKVLLSSAKDVEKVQKVLKFGNPKGDSMDTDKKKESGIVNPYSDPEILAKKRQEMEEAYKRGR